MFTKAPIALLTAATVLLDLSACVGPTPAQVETPAVIVGPTVDGRIELQSVMSAALHGAQITLSNDALTRESSLAVERLRVRDTQGRQLNGRELERPDIFQLMKVGSECVLIHQASGVRTRLSEVRCVAAAQ